MPSSKMLTLAGMGHKDQGFTADSRQPVIVLAAQDHPVKWVSWLQLSITMDRASNYAQPWLQLRSEVPFRNHDTVSRCPFEESLY